MKNKPKLSDLTNSQLADLIMNRWASFGTIADEINKISTRNIKIYKGEPDWIDRMPTKKQKTRTNRIFVDTEAVINTLIANPPKPNILPNFDFDEVKDVALAQERYFNTRYNELDTKKEIRKGLRNLYFSRLICLKPFWNPEINDFDVKNVDPTKVRMSKNATSEDESEFFIEEVTEEILITLSKFPEQQAYLLQQSGCSTYEEAMIRNPEIKYYEAWIQDQLIYLHQKQILAKMPNPYWDWEGIRVTEEELSQLNGGEEIDPLTAQPKPPITGDARRELMFNIKTAQESRKMQELPTIEKENEPSETGEAEELRDEAGENLMEDSAYTPTPVTLQQYYFNYFDKPRKPYIIATVFDNGESPIGITDMIFLASSLQESIDTRKIDISDNCQLVNGWLKVESTVMNKTEAKKLRFEAQGVVWGKGVVAGVVREMGTPLPQMVFQDMEDSRQEIDNIMAATSAFRGERQGTETKGGRLALVDQSYLRLNELIQVVDYVCGELFAWWYQLAKLRYTEYHYAKTLGADMGLKITNIIQDDFIDGSQMRIIPGKTLPEDRQFLMEQAQRDAELGYISPEDYMQIAGYDDPKMKLRNAVLYGLNPMGAVGITPEEAGIPPPMPIGEVPVA